MRRSNLLVIAGIAFFVVGVVIVALLSRDSGSGTAKASGTVDVLVAKEDIPAGTNGDDATSKVEVRRVENADRQPDALSTPSQLSNQLLTATFSKNEQIRSGGLKVRSISPSVQVPAGKEAIAVSVPFVAGGAGYLAPGDLVNVYQVIPGPVQDVTGGALPYSTPRTQLLLTNVKVIDVQQQVAALGATPASNQTGVVSRPASSTDNLTVLLALDAIDAEKVIFGSSTTSINLYLTRVGDKAAPSGPTPGRDYTNIFGESPEVANVRDHT
ncbi:MAG: pilus assembly protein CpaB [Acidimicrobiaceae bacterium]